MAVNYLQSARIEESSTNLRMQKRRNHYVSKFYLKAWAEGKRIYCLRGGRIRPMGLDDVAMEKDFYKVQNLQPEDIEIIWRAVIEPSPELARPIHEELLKDFAYVATLSRLAQKSDASNETTTALTELISNLDENYHETIEHDLQITLGFLLAGNADFFSDVRLAGSFLRALALQSLRTKKRREAMCALVPIPLSGAAMERIWGPMSHILAVNIGGSLVQDRSLFRIILLRNNTDLAFITGDQPVINVNDDRDFKGIPAEVEFYYPLSPKLAMWFVLASKAPKEMTVALSEAEVRSYNARIVENHHEQLYANRESALTEWINSQN